jgi:hypothetical protein
MAVTKRLRFEILKRDNHACRYCGAAAPDAVLTIDHVVPVALGGTDLPENLVTACKDCNAGKSSTPAEAALVADVADDAIRWRKAMQIAAEVSSTELDQKNAFLAEFLDVWNSWTYTVPSYRSGSGKEETKTVPLPGGWRTSVGEIMAAGLPMVQVVDAITVTMGKNVKDEWSYFCGVCWNKLRQQQQLAQAVIAGGGV